MNRALTEVYAIATGKPDGKPDFYKAKAWMVAVYKDIDSCEDLPTSNKLLVGTSNPTKDAQIIQVC